MSFGLQFSSQKANDSFLSAILEHKNSAAKLGTAYLPHVFKWRKVFYAVIFLSTSEGSFGFVRNIRCWLLILCRYYGFC
jgi:hypothetical protein